jgi:hypothetical protein
MSMINVADIAVNNMTKKNRWPSFLAKNKEAKNTLNIRTLNNRKVLMLKFGGGFLLEYRCSKRSAIIAR